jgi:two-component system phosphate regulon sensor histidine kinase PhoR
MSLTQRWSRGSRKLAGLLLAVTVPPLVTLVWVGLLLVGEDRERVERRLYEERQVALRTMAQSLDRSLIDLERHLTDGPVPTGLVRLSLSADGVAAGPSDGVLWLPARDVQVERASASAAAELAEHRGEVAAALALNRELLNAPDATVRAGAIVRIARIHRKARQWDAALGHYRRLATMTDVRVAGAPADLQARRAICDVLEQAGRRDELARESAALGDDFNRHRWLLDRPGWELTAADISRWTGSPLPIDRSRLMMSQAAARLWPEQLQTSSESTRRFVTVVDDGPVTVLARAHGGGVSALVVPRQFIETALARAASTTTLATGSVALQDNAGRLVGGGVTVKDGDEVLTLAAAKTGLPWAIVLGPEDPAVVVARLADRRWLLLLGFGTMLVFVAGSGVFLWRLVRRELAVSRLQTEFVATVSHEFRTPLTSLRLAWEVLDEGDDVPVEQRRSIYGVIGRNSARLQRLVESLLDFSRMESGRKPYELVPLDAGALIGDVVTDFRRQVPAAAIDVTIDGARPLMLRGDRSALGHAIWNLLDNAVKYSPDGARVRASVRGDDVSIAIVVTDQGVGVPVAEQRTIFDQFVRGERARQLGVNGTGLGLAIVSHIVRAHQGTVGVESSGEGGSTFTMTVPRAGDGTAETSVRVPA